MEPENSQKAQILLRLFLSFILKKYSSLGSQERGGLQFPNLTLLVLFSLQEYVSNHNYCLQLMEMYSLFLTKDKLHLVHFEEIHELYKISFNFTLFYTKQTSCELQKGNKELDGKVTMLAKFSFISQQFGEYLLDMNERTGWNEQQCLEHLEQLRSGIISVRALIYCVLSLKSTTDSFGTTFQNSYLLKDSFDICFRILQKSIKFIEGGSLSAQDKQRRLFELESFKSLYTYLKIELNIQLKQQLNLTQMIEEMLHCSVISFHIIQALGFSLKQRKKYSTACILFRQYLGLCQQSQIGLTKSNWISLYRELIEISGQKQEIYSLFRKVIKRIQEFTELKEENERDLRQVLTVVWNVFVDASSEQKDAQMWNQSIHCFIEQIERKNLHSNAPMFKILIGDIQRMLASKQ